MSVPEAGRMQSCLLHTQTPWQPQLRDNSRGICQPRERTIWEAKPSTCCPISVLTSRELLHKAEVTFQWHKNKQWAPVKSLESMHLLSQSNRRGSNRDEICTDRQGRF